MEASHDVPDAFAAGEPMTENGTEVEAAGLMKEVSGG